LRLSGLSLDTRIRIFWRLRRLQAEQESGVMGKGRRRRAAIRAAAYREAGHAVVADFWEIRIRRASIVKQRPTSMAGFTTTR
jgi:hypothetical protein